MFHLGFSYIGLIWLMMLFMSPLIRRDIEALVALIR